MSVGRRNAARRFRAAGLRGGACELAALALAATSAWASGRGRRTGPPAPKTLRNLEQEGELVGDPGRTLANALLLLPRDIVNGVLASTAYGTEPTDDPKLIERSDCVFPLPKKTACFPASTCRASRGSRRVRNVYYRGRETGVIVSGVFRNSQLLERGRDRGLAEGRTGARCSSSAWSPASASDDAYRFFGLGPTPPTTPGLPCSPGPRSDCPSAGTSTATIRRRSSPECARPSGVELYYETNYRRRTIRDLPESDEPLGNYFDLAALPGLGTGKQWYNELSARFDTRRYRGLGGPGLTVAVLWRPLVGQSAETSAASAAREASSSRTCRSSAQSADRPQDLGRPRVEPSAGRRVVLRRLPAAPHLSGRERSPDDPPDRQLGARALARVPVAPHLQDAGPGLLRPAGGRPDPRRGPGQWLPLGRGIGPREAQPVPNPRPAARWRGAPRASASAIELSPPVKTNDRTRWN